jgi:hypothetical protein
LLPAFVGRLSGGRVRVLCVQKVLFREARLVLCFLKLA